MKEVMRMAVHPPCPGSWCKILLKTGKKAFRKLAYSDVCTISIESRISVAVRSRFSVSADSSWRQR